MAHPYQSTWLKARGELVKTTHGVKIDFSSGIFTSNLGHDNPAVKAAIIKQLNKGFTNTYRHPTEIREQYTEALKSYFGAKGVFLFSTGAEAVEAAFRMSRMSPFAMVDGGFHGKTKATLNYKGRSGNILRSDFLAMRGYPLSGLIMEPYRPYDARWHSDIWMEAVKSRFSTIIFDEVQSAFHRTGTKLAYTQYKGLQPDYVILGKAMGNGFPMSAVLSFVGGQEIWPPGADSSTYGGNPLACAAGLSVINWFKDRPPAFYFNLNVKNGIMKDMLPKSQGRGLCRALFVGYGLADESAFVRACFDRGVIVIPTGKGWIKLAPPLTIRKAYLRYGLKIIKGVYDGMFGS